MFSRTGGNFHFNIVAAIFHVGLNIAYSRTEGNIPSGSGSLDLSLIFSSYLSLIVRLNAGIYNVDAGHAFRRSISIAEAGGPD